MPRTPHKVCGSRSTARCTRTRSRRGCINAYRRRDRLRTGLHRAVGNRRRMNENRGCNSGPRRDRHTRSSKPGARALTSPTSSARRGRARLFTSPETFMDIPRGSGERDKGNDDSCPGNLGPGQPPPRFAWTSRTARSLYDPCAVTDVAAHVVHIKSAQSARGNGSSRSARSGNPRGRNPGTATRCVRSAPRSVSIRVRIRTGARGRAIPAIRRALLDPGQQSYCTGQTKADALPSV